MKGNTTFNGGFCPDPSSLILQSGVFLAARDELGVGSELMSEWETVFCAHPSGQCKELETGCACIQEL